jgi:predicted PurR-regulated permease PerM
MEQQQEVKEYPFYLKATLVLFGLVLFFYILWALSSVLVPFAFAGLFAILLNPLFNRLDSRLPRVVAILLTLLIATVIIGSILYFLSTQIASFSNDIPLIKQKFTSLIDRLQHWVHGRFGPGISKKVDAIQQSLETTDTGTITSTLGTVFSFLSVLFLLPIYIFLLLYYKPLLLEFIFQISSEKHSLRVAEILSNAKTAIQSFMVGLMWETSIVCVLNSMALLIIGVPNAIVIGVLGGLLNILPYVGGLIAIALPVLMALIVTDGYSTILAIIGSYLFIQFIDNNFLVPRIVSSKVKINALISVLVVLLGGLLWGISGMFLSIPFIAILKIIFDRIEELKPWGKLLGDEIPTEHIGVVWQKRWARIFRRLEKERIEEEAKE